MGIILTGIGEQQINFLPQRNVFVILRLGALLAAAGSHQYLILMTLYFC